MKVIGFVSTAVLSLTLGVTATAYAQGEQHADKQDRPRQQQDKPQQARHDEGKPTAQHAQARPDQGKHEEHAQQSQRQNQNRSQEQAQQQKQQDQNKHEQHAQQQQQVRTIERNHAQQQQEQTAQRHAQQQHNQLPQRTPERQRIEHTAWQQHRSQHWDSDHRTWQQRGGYNGYRIPDARFRGYLGRDHGFRISGLPFLVVGGYPRFQYSGYWFSPIDPWPEYWATDWYDTDDVYVMYLDNGYYMYNRRYPSTGIAIRISL